ncbi:hypothetical protein ACFFMN_36175 [Planobispora siamensis]|uniref:Uncharacterized protein n=1 Tax=Planobispora siamensis TaxID=936338 RepID=A0A8J3SWZ2_9ACTN|nr:hypothetical protein [Planobispora siamensis]GIH97063.1 hypothetical protein Psi01_76930 [Planobispora siamensis]
MTLWAGPGSSVHATAAKDFVRYADDSCPGKNGEYYVCAPWRLSLRGGKVIRLKEARVFIGPGKKIRAPFALSPHGSKAAYFRLKDGALVVRDITTGRVRVVPGIRWPVDLPLQISLSPGGRFVVLRGDYLQPRRVLDTVTGRTHPLPAGRTPWSFSPDNAHLLASDGDGRSVVYSTADWSVVRRARTPAGSLHTDGTTIAYIDRRGGHRIRFLNLVTGRPAGAPLKIPADESGHWLLWDRAGNLDLLTMVKSRSAGDHTTFRWRRASDGMRVLDTFTNRSSDEIDVITGLPDL